MGYRALIALSFLASCCFGFGQRALPLGNGTLLHLKIYYMGLDAETRARVTPEFLRKVGDIIELRDAGEIRGVRNLLRDSRTPAEAAPKELRMLIEVNGQEPVYVDGNGNISQGKLTWQMEPRDFLMLYFQMEELDKKAIKRK